MYHAIVNTIENTIVFVDWITYEIHIWKTIVYPILITLLEKQSFQNL